MHTPHVMSGGRYPVLRSFAIMYVLFAGLAILAGVIGIIYTMIRAPYAMTDRVIMSVGIAAATCFAVLTTLAVAELLKLFIDIEHNPRASAGAPQAEPRMMGSDNHMNRMHALDEET